LSVHVSETARTSPMPLRPMSAAVCVTASCKIFCAQKKTSCSMPQAIAEPATAGGILTPNRIAASPCDNSLATGLGLGELDGSGGPTGSV